ncbi:MAG: translation initiation factor IF-2 associated domain-containing protein, partial [Oleiphilaceae bacterium]|nr:translation initiation factor IF-2 associated domain-containing protein [Oleiphilaceae bacterium]
MADVTVKQLANDVGAPVDRLLRQMVEAGLKARSENDSVTNDEKQQLLTYLRKNHGESDAEPQKITLKRKTTTTLKAGSGASRAKTVNVEVRKKRTYVKRAETQPEAEPEEVAPQAAEAPPEPAAPPVQPVEEPSPVKFEESQQVAPEGEPGVQAVTGDSATPTSPPEPAPEPAAPEASDVIDPADMPIPPPDPENAKDKDRKPKKKKEKVRERAPEEPGEGKPKKKSAGHRGPRNRPVEEPVVISEDDEDTTLRKPLRAKKKPKEKRHAFERPTKPMVREVEIPEIITVGDLAQRM